MLWSPLFVPWACRQLASEEPASGALQVTSPVSSALNSPSGLDSHSEEIKVNSDSGLCFLRHTLLNRSVTDVFARGWVQRSTLSCPLSHLSKVCHSSRFSLTARETGVNVRLDSPGTSQVLTSAALPVSLLTSQWGPVFGQDHFISPILGPVPGLVDLAIQCSSREASTGFFSPVGYVHRCLLQRLGSPLWRSVSSRPLAAYWGDLSRQRAGVTSHSKCSLHFLPLIRSKVVMFRSDNSSAVAYLQNQGGTDSLPMFCLTWDILLLCLQHGITLSVKHVPSCLNVLANSLSRRNQIIGT